MQYLKKNNALLSRIRGLFLTGSYTCQHVRMKQKKISVKFFSLYAFAVRFDSYNRFKKTKQIFLATFLLQIVSLFENSKLSEPFKHSSLLKFGVRYGFILYIRIRIRNTAF